MCTTWEAFGKSHPCTFTQHCHTLNRQSCQLSAQAELAAQPLIDGTTACAVVSCSSGRSQGADLTRSKVCAQQQQPCSIQNEVSTGQINKTTQNGHSLIAEPLSRAPQPLIGGISREHHSVIPCHADQIFAGEGLTSGFSGTNSSVSLNEESIHCAKGFSNFGPSSHLVTTTPYTCDALETRIVVSIIDAKFKHTTGIPYPASGQQRFNTPP